MKHFLKILLNLSFVFNLLLSIKQTNHRVDIVCILFFSNFCHIYQGTPIFLAWFTIFLLQQVLQYKNIYIYIHQPKNGLASIIERYICVFFIQHFSYSITICHAYMLTYRICLRFTLCFTMTRKNIYLSTQSQKCHYC